MASGKRITKLAVERLALGEQLWDADVRGFGIRRRKRDAVYMLKVRINGVQRLITIGRHGSPWTAETARGEAQRVLGGIHSGNDPATKRDARKRELTLSAVLEKYLAEHVRHNNKASTIHQVERLIETRLKPALGHHKISDLSREHIKQWHTSLRAIPYEANRSLAYLRKALTLACTDYGYRADNPATGVGKFPEKARARYFVDAELSAIGKAVAAAEDAGTTQPGAVRAVRLLALTGMRLSEVCGLQWGWIDFEQGCAHLPIAKSGARAVPLGGAALAYLNSVERIGEFVCFAPDPARAISTGTVETFWGRLRIAAELTNARLHDFRHTTGTFTAQTGVNAFVVRDVLGHKNLATTQIYVSRVADQARKAADTVSERIAAAMAATNPDTVAAKVVPFRKA